MAVSYIWNNVSGTVPGCGSSNQVTVTFSDAVWNSWLLLQTYPFSAYGKTFCLDFNIATPSQSDQTYVFGLQYLGVDDGRWHQFLSSNSSRTGGQWLIGGASYGNFAKTMQWRLDVSYYQFPSPINCFNVPFTGLTLGWTDACTGGSGVPTTQGSSAMLLREVVGTVHLESARLTTARSYVQIID